MEVEEYSLKDLLSRIVDNRGRTCPTAETGTALIATNCIKDDQLYPVFENVRWVDQETMETWFRGHPEPGDILFVLKGSPGRCCLVPDPINFCIAQDMLALRADESKVSQKFLFALLRSSIVRNAIDNLHVGTMIPHFKKGDFDQLTFQIPKSRKIQEWIGDQYFILSDKIELNRRMNATLEGMAQALFKSWFVDFDPVIDNALAAGNPIPDELAARAEVRRQALANGTANRDAAKHFPAAFQQTESMGWIPEGWEVKTIGDLCVKIQNGGTPKRDNEEFWNNGTIPWLTSGEVRQSVILSVKNTITEYGLANSSAKWLPARSTVVAMYGATAGQVAFIYNKLTTNQAVCGLVPKEHFQYFNYLLIEGNVKHFENQARGSAQQNISKGIIEESAAIIPPLHVVQSFEGLAHPMFEKWAKNMETNDQLSKLRDTLLPKLISGEIRLPKAEQLTEEALT